MSAIPPSNAIASILQSGIAQAEQARTSDSEKNAAAEASRRLTGGPDVILEIEEPDADHTEIHPDAGGLGGQGRYDAPTEDQPDEETEDTGVVKDAAGQLHIDFSA